MASASFAGIPICFCLPLGDAPEGQFSGNVLPEKTLSRTIPNLNRGMRANSQWTGSIHWTCGARHQSVGAWLRAGILVYLSASRKLRDLQLSKLTRFDRFNRGLQQGSGIKNSAQIIRRKFQDRNPPATEVLLITDTLIGGDEQIELPFRQAQEFAVCDAFPTAIAYLSFAKTRNRTLCD